MNWRIYLGLTAHLLEEPFSTQFCLRAFTFFLPIDKMCPYRQYPRGRVGADLSE